MSVLKLIDPETKNYTIFYSMFKNDMVDCILEQTEHYISNTNDDLSKFWMDRDWNIVTFENLNNTLYDYVQFLNKQGDMYNNLVNDKLCTQMCDEWKVLIKPPPPKAVRAKKEPKQKK